MAVNGHPLHESIKTLDYLRREAALGKREDFEQFLKLVPDVPAQAIQNHEPRRTTQKQVRRL